MHNLDDESWKHRKDAIQMWEADVEASLEQAKIRDVLGRNAGASFGERCYIAPDCNFFTHGATLGNNVRIGSQVTLRGNLTFGDDVSINPMTNIVGVVNIGKAVRIASGVQIFGFNHGFSRIDKYIKDQPVSSKGVVLGNGCWVGAGACIVDGVTLGENSIVAAGAVVTKSFPPFSIIGGSPARLLKNRLGHSGKKILVEKVRSLSTPYLAHVETPATGFLDINNQMLNGWIAYKGSTESPSLLCECSGQMSSVPLKNQRPDVVDFLNRTNRRFKGAKAFAISLKLAEGKNQLYVEDKNGNTKVLVVSAV